MAEGIFSSSLNAESVSTWTYASLAMATGVMTLGLNGAWSGEFVALAAALAVGAVMMGEVGVIFGAWAKDTNTLFAAFKTGGLLLFYPVIFFIWPDLPGWIARLGPTYYFLQPIFDLAVNDAGLGDVADDIAIGVAICGALVPAVSFMARRLERTRGEGRVAPVADEG